MTLLQAMLAVFLVKYSAAVKLDPSLAVPARVSRASKAVSEETLEWSERQMQVMEAQLAVHRESLELKKRIVSLPCTVRVC